MGESAIRLCEMLSSTKVYNLSQVVWKFFLGIVNLEIFSYVV